MATRGSNHVNSEPPTQSSFFIQRLKQSILHVQEYARLSFRSVANLFSPPHYVVDLVQQMDRIGVGSLPIVMLTGGFIGGILVLQTASQFARFGQTALTGDVTALGLVRELGPTITGLLVAGRNASAMASELGSMVVSEQVDAMRAMGTDPSRKLVTPRVVATTLMLPLLVAVGDLIGLIGGYIVSRFTLSVGAVQFWSRAIDALVLSDIAQGLVKPVVFGFIIATVGCYQGLNVKGGTEGVGRATTTAVVVSSVVILVADLFLSKFMLYAAAHFF